MREVSVYVAAHGLRYARLNNHTSLATRTNSHLDQQLAIVGYLISHFLIVQILDYDIAARLYAQRLPHSLSVELGYFKTLRVGSVGG